MFEFKINAGAKLINNLNVVMDCLHLKLVNNLNDVRLINDYTYFNKAIFMFKLPLNRIIKI